MPATETVASLLRRWRHRIDEELDPGTNFWSDTEGVEYMNEGMREVWQTVREAHEDRFVRTLQSDQGKVTLSGRSYDTSLLQIQSGRAEVVLPPDFHELLLFETVPPGDGTVSRLLIQQAKFQNMNFRNNALRTSSTAGEEFFYNIEFRETAAVMILAPVPAIDTARVMVMKYVQAPRTLVKTDNFEESGFEPFMLDAVIAFMVYRARCKSEDDQAIKTSMSEWEAKRTFALRACGPRQTRDAEYVEGPYEEDWE